MQAPEGCMPDCCASSKAKLLKQLTSTGLVASRRGAGGGYALGRPATEITVASIIDALEGPIALAACVDGSVEQCEVEGICPMRGNWNPVNQVIRRALEEVSLHEMAAPVIPIPHTAVRPAVRPAH